MNEYYIVNVYVSTYGGEMQDPWQTGFDTKSCRNIDLGQTGNRETGASTLCQVNCTQSHVHC